ncbi:MAG: aminotransferase class III-fold pyridoxal phosphate-dependent enzyme, partial [Deltaproteobacteria bacterium]|nr:aminotransferase class III-fold pyridoxal phosphate-dependent enzyme [Deltaproteobacteria bacterium]
EDGLLEHCTSIGHYFKERLEELGRKHSLIKEVRGLGLILGVELNTPGAPIVRACQEEGFLIVCAHENVLRFVPPLIVEKDEIDRLVETLDRILGGLKIED